MAEARGAFDKLSPNGGPHEAFDKLSPNGGLCKGFLCSAGTQGQIMLTHLLMTRYTVADDGTVKLDPKASFSAQINPADFKHSYGVQYDKTKTVGDAATDPKFASVDDERIGFSLVLDGTGVVPVPENGQREDVKAQMKKLNAVVYEYVTLKKEPPYVRLLWGTLIFFGRLESISAQYTLFKPSGDPLRARVELSFIGAMSKKESLLVSNRQSDAVQKQVTVREGDTLSLLCQDHYGSDSDYASEVARYNNLPNLVNLKPGTQLLLPPVE